MTSNESVLPTKEQVYKILEYLPYFNDTKNSFYEFVPPREIKPGVTYLPYYNYSSVVSDFIKCLEDHKFLITPYDHKCVRKYFGLLKGEIESSNINMLDIRNIFSFVVNAETFCEGQIARAIEKGIFLKMLQRLNGIMQEIQFRSD